MRCTHNPAERDIAQNAGSCPVCLNFEVAELRVKLENKEAEIQSLKDRLVRYERRSESGESQVDLWDALDKLQTAKDKLAVAKEALQDCNELSYDKYLQDDAQDDIWKISKKALLAIRREDK